MKARIGSTGAGFFYAKIMTVKKIILSGEIGWDITPSGVRGEIDAAAGADLDVHLASPGGFVTDGIEIYNLFRDYKRTYPAAQLSLTIKGDAMSMASYLAVNPAWDLVAAEDNAIFMIHNAWGGVVGDYRDMRKMAEVLDGMNGIIGKAYTAKTGKNEKEIRRMMDDETWYFGDEIKTAGFVDEIIKTESDKDRSAAMASGKMKFSALSKKLNEPADRCDVEKIAALLRPLQPAHNPATETRDNNYQEDSMTLEQFLKENPAARIEHEAAVKAATEAGYKQGKEDQLSINARAAKFAESADYPAAVKGLAIDVMQGKKSIDALEALAANADMLKELVSSQNAAVESQQSASTQGQHTPAPEIYSVAEMIKRDKLALGLEV